MKSGIIIRINGKYYSRNQIARGTGMSVSGVSRIFSGKRSPSLATLRILGNFFGLHPVDVLRIIIDLTSNEVPSARRRVAA